MGRSPDRAHAPDRSVPVGHRRMGRTPQGSPHWMRSCASVGRGMYRGMGGAMSRAMTRPGMHGEFGVRVRPGRHVAMRLRRRSGRGAGCEYKRSSQQEGLKQPAHEGDCEEPAEPFQSIPTRMAERSSTLDAEKSDNYSAVLPTSSGFRRPNCSKPFISLCAVSSFSLASSETLARERMHAVPLRPRDPDAARQPVCSG